MSQYESEGIVVRKYNLSDADRIAIVLTRKYGLIRGVAGGAKRLKSRFGGSLEFFSTVRLSFFRKENKDLATIRECELVSSVLNSLSDSDIFLTFGEIADLLIRMTPPYEVNSRLYEMTSHCVNSIIDEPESAASIRKYFEIWLLRLAGFLPDWTKCGSCSREFVGDERSFLDVDFQLSCEDCKTTGNVSGSVRTLLLTALTKSAPAFHRASDVDPDSLNDLGVIVNGISDAVLERAPNQGFSAYSNEKDAA